jgi:succinate dehydrogenase/fumarate reductase flavoprotein subunit
MSPQNHFEKIVTPDVLVVGTGGAGLRAGIKAAERGLKVMVVSKGKAGRSGVTIMAGSDLVADGKGIQEIGVPGDPEDTPQKFMEEIVSQGFYLNNQKLVELYVSTAKDRLKELVDHGLKIIYAEGRTIYATGRGIIDACMLELKEHKNVEFLENTFLTNILTENKRVTGAIGIDVATGDIILFKTKAIVLATGGWHKMYGLNTGSTEMSGDGVAAALKAGCEAINLEMVTFCANVIAWPERWKRSIFMYLLHMFTSGSLLDSDGKTFLDQYYPDKETYDIATKTEWNKLLISLAEAKVIKEGRGTPHGGVYFSVAGIPWEKIEKGQLAFFLPGWKLHGDDCSQVIEMLHKGQRIEVKPMAHYFEGGLKINERCETQISGLYAAGECTSGTFGANRVAAATTEILVQGAKAGEEAAKYAEKAVAAEVIEEQVQEARERLLNVFKVKEGIMPSKLLKDVQRIADEKVGVIRNGKMLRSALDEMAEIKKLLPKMAVAEHTRNYNLEWIEALEVENLVLLLEATAKAALMRTESRGVHYREDYPVVDDDNWLKEIAVRLKPDGSLQLSTDPVITTTIKLPRGKTPYEKYITNMAQSGGA